MLMLQQHCVAHTCKSLPACKQAAAAQTRRSPCAMSRMLISLTVMNRT